MEENCGVRKTPQVKFSMLSSENMRLFRSLLDKTNMSPVLTVFAEYCVVRGRQVLRSVPRAVNISLVDEVDEESSYRYGVSFAACCLSSAGSDAGSSLCADGLGVQEALHCLCASTHPGRGEQETLQR